MKRIPIVQLDACAKWHIPETMGEVIVTKEDLTYGWSRVTVRLLNDTVQFVFTGDTVTPRCLEIEEFWRFTATEIIQRYDGFGDHFAEAVIQTYKVTKLPIGETEPPCTV